MVLFATDPEFGQFDHSYRKDMINEVIQGLEEDSCLQFVNMTGGKPMSNHL